MTPKELLYTKLHFLRLAVDGSIVDDIKATVDDVVKDLEEAKGFCKKKDELIAELKERKKAILKQLDNAIQKRDAEIETLREQRQEWVELAIKKQARNEELENLLRWDDCPELVIKNPSWLLNMQENEVSEATKRWAADIIEKYKTEINNNQPKNDIGITKP